MEVGQVGAVVITVLKAERVLIHLLLVVVRTVQVLPLRHAGKLTGVGQVGAVVITVLKAERVLIHLLLVVVRTVQVLLLRHAGM